MPFPQKILAFQIYALCEETINITLQSSLYWSPADAPAINPTQTLSHFCSLMSVKYGIKTKKINKNKNKCRSQENIYSWKQPTKPMLQVRCTCFNSYHTQCWMPYSTGQLLVQCFSLAAECHIIDYPPPPPPARGRVVQVCVEWKGCLNNCYILTPSFRCGPLYWQM